MFSFQQTEFLGFCYNKTMERKLEFPQGFLWGSATSAYQVEGGLENSDWSEKFPADLACDHYHRYKEDFEILQKLKQNAYRFSLEWSRLEPEEGKFDEKEIEHYRQYLQALRLRGIRVMVTLHHFSNPLWLAKLGGWANRKVVFYFSRFSERVFKEYKDLVDYWVTINEPAIYASLSYLEARWPPQKRNPVLFLSVIKNQILAHQKVYEIFHRTKTNVLVGIVENIAFIEPFSDNFLDKLSVSLSRYFIYFILRKVRRHLDFIGLNYYFHRKIQFPFYQKNENKIISDLGWEIYPQGIYYVLKDLSKYNLPIYITENGLADKEDKLRKDFMEKHLFWIHQAISEGVDVKGYFHWSLLDNFEWADGFNPRFGLIEINYKTLERKIRASALFYAQICENNSLIIKE